MQWLFDLLRKLWTTPIIVDHIVVAPQPPTWAPTTPPAILEPTMPATTDKIKVFCLTIQAREGWYGPGQLAGYPHGTPSYRDNNPGNCRWPFGAPYPAGATGVDTSEFLIFQTYQQGFQYLEDITRAVCSGKASLEGAYQLAAKKKGLPDCSYLTIADYFVVRDPASDNNDPASYATQVAKAVGLPVTAMMLQLLK